MFGQLTEKLQGLFKSLSGNKTLTEENVSEAAREVRLALLDADVNYTVVGNFVKRVKEKTLSMQSKLHSLGYYKGELDGILGPEMKEAIREFQRANNRTPDGEISPTLERLLDAK